MPTSLNLFPVRVPFGRFTDAAGKNYDVLMTPEFARALSDLMKRIGGTTGLSTEEISMLAASVPSESATVAALQQHVADLSAQLEAAHQVAARVAKLEKMVEQLAYLASEAGPVPVDWEHPGKVGAATANSGKFTTLEATDAVNLHPQDKPIDIKPTGTSLVTIKPAAVGQVDNMELGTTVPQKARVLNVNKVIVVEPATSAYIQIADGKGIAVNRSIVLTASADGITLNIAGGGTLGTAAFRNGGASTENWTAATLTSSGGFACNGADPQGKQNSGGTLAGVIQCLKNNGILSG